MLFAKLRTIQVLLVMIAALLTTSAPTLLSLFINNSLWRLFIVLLLLFNALPTNWVVKHALQLKESKIQFGKIIERNRDD